MPTGNPISDAGIAVVHLALGSFGIEPFRAFVDSYRAHDAAHPHEFVIALKQVAAADADRYRDLLEGINHRLIHVPDEGYDLGSYWHVARETDYGAYCFLNSRSTILTDGWLAKLVAAAATPGVAAVGATGSLESIAGNALHLVGVTHRWPAPLGRLRGLLGFLKLVRRFPPFPNPHLRTNAFLVSRERMLRVRAPVIADKTDAWRFESGWRGMTRQLTCDGGRVLVVDADGAAYPVDRWSQSGTFWQAGQPRLLVADRQTRAYDQADPGARRMMERAAWTKPGSPASAD